MTPVTRNFPAVLPRDPQIARRRVIVAGLACSLASITLLALSAGAMQIPLNRVIGILLSELDLPGQMQTAPHEVAALIAIRLPRIVLALAVGAVLGIAGASLQALFRNPLADPSLVGVADGAACGAVSWIVFGGFGLAGLGTWGLLLVAFVGGLTATAGVMVIARGQGRLDVATLLLAGLAMKALTGALLGYMIFLANDVQMRSLTFWLLGSLGGATWSAILPASLLMGLSVAILLSLARQFDIFALGEAEAGHLGVHVERTKWIAITAVALGTGAATAITGIVGFVGLMAPHIIRLAGGPGHRYVLPASALLGALLTVSADTLARILVSPAELPIGVVTSAVGAPFFFWLLNTRARTWS